MSKNDKNVLIHSNFNGNGLHNYGLLLFLVVCFLPKIDTLGKKEKEAME